jgi:hypothetical protein
VTRGAFGKSQKFCETIYGLPANEIWGAPGLERPSAIQWLQRRSTVLAAEAQMQLRGNGRAPWRSSSCHQSICTHSGTLTQLIASGMDVLTISRRLGHGSPTVTLSVYGHLFSNSGTPAPPR